MLWAEDSDEVDDSEWDYTAESEQIATANLLERYLTEEWHHTNISLNRAAAEIFGIEGPASEEELTQPIEIVTPSSMVKA